MPSVNNTVALILAFIALCSAQRRDTCEANQQFRCDDGQCIQILGRCDLNAHEDCRDGSDETPQACSVPNTTLAVGQWLQAEIQYDTVFEELFIVLCSGETCDKLYVRGATADGAMWYQSWVKCNRANFRCTLVRSEAPPGWAPFSSGRIVFTVRRSPRNMTVWLRGHPEHKASVPVTRADAKQTFKIRPVIWPRDMPTTFSKLPPG
ncbi:hypothetical protein ONE63_010365 [Megalurothrips usitatus]|nr:hypothetical protein ONE63_010365 [Megalurothrips usitatus]